MKNKNNILFIFTLEQMNFVTPEFIKYLGIRKPLCLSTCMGSDQNTWQPPDSDLGAFTHPQC